MIEQLEVMLSKIFPYIPNILFILLVVFAVLFADRLTERICTFLYKRFGLVSTATKYIIKLTIYILAIIIILMNIPGLKKDILQLFGLIVGGIIAFSSSSIIANGMCGLLIKMIRHYNIGDIVEFDSDLGEVTEIGWFHTEIQTDKRKLITIPNSIIMSKKITNISRTGTFVSARVSIGYDASRLKVEELLLKSAKTVGLENIYVSIIDLGDYSVKYEINGFLKDVGRIIIISSQLRKEILDEFSKAQLEIVSPMFVNIKQQPLAKIFMAKYTTEETTEDLKKASSEIENIVFAKGKKAQFIVKETEILKRQIIRYTDDIGKLNKAIKAVDDENLKKNLEARKVNAENKLKELEEMLKKLQEMRSSI